MKICSKCKIEKDLSEFSKRPGTKDKLQHICKKCVNIYDELYRKNNKEKIKKSNQKQYMCGYNNMKCKTKESF